MAQIWVLENSIIFPN